MATGTAVASRDGLATRWPRAKDGPFACMIRSAPCLLGRNTLTRGRFDGSGRAGGRQPSRAAGPTAPPHDERPPKPDVGRKAVDSFLSSRIGAIRTSVNRLNDAHEVVRVVREELTFKMPRILRDRCALAYSHADQ
jgi:hypothetical protein